MKLSRIIELSDSNLAEHLDEDKLGVIGLDVVEGYENDVASRSEWENKNADALKLALQYVETKTFPWPNACYSLDTDILTRDGWKPVADVVVGEFVYTRSPSGVASFQPVTRTFRYKNQLAVHFEGKSIDLLVTPNHKMLVETKDGRTEFIEAGDFLKNKLTARYIPLTSSYNGELRPTTHGIDSFRYARFLGWYISEGWSFWCNNSYTTVDGERKNYGRSESSVGIAQSKSANPEKYEILRQDIEACGFSYSEKDNGFIVHARSMPDSLRDELRELGKAHEKRIPRHVFDLDETCLEQLLDTLILGDGNINSRIGRADQRYYFTVSERLAGDVQELAQRIGLRATVSEKSARLGGVINGRQIVGGLVQYSVSICRKDRIQVSKLSRRLVKHTEDVACVEVPPHNTVFVRRNGKAVWCGNSNVKYPLVLVACIQFNARALPALIPGERVVECQKPPEAPAELTEIAKAVSDDMNWQIMGGEWDDGHDLLLMMLPLIGTVFKKTFYDPDKGENVSYPIHPSNFVVDYWAKSLEDCERKTHVHYLRPNAVEEKKRLGYYRDLEYGKEAERSETQKVSDAAQGFEQPAERDTFTFLEQCCWIDLDGDGYKEPYVVTVDKASRKVARIVDNFKEITLVNKGTRLKITPDEYTDDLSFMKVGRITEEQYYTKYGFIRSPDGGFYDVGLGTLLSPINHAVDSLVNMMVDGGVLYTAGGGLVSRNVRVRSGTVDTMPGRWKRTDASGEELSKGVFPWPTREPSHVLFQLLGLLLKAGEDIGSTPDMVRGQNPGQNQAATTSLAVLEQGLQVFSTIYLRIFRSMKEEFRKWYVLNRRYGVNPELYQLPIRTIRPTADPKAVSKQVKLLKAEALKGGAAQTPHLYGVKGLHLAERKYLEALDVVDIDEFLVPIEEVQPPQDPKALEAQAKQEQWAQEFELRSQLDMAKEQREQERAKSSIMKDMVSAKTKMMTATLNEEKQQWQEYMDRLNLELEMIDRSIETKRLSIEQRRVERESSNQAAASGA